MKLHTRSYSMRPSAGLMKATSLRRVYSLAWGRCRAWACSTCTAWGSSWPGWRRPTGCPSSPGPATSRSALPELAWAQVRTLAPACQRACLGTPSCREWDGLTTADIKTADGLLILSAPSCTKNCSAGAGVGATSHLGTPCAKASASLNVLHAELLGRTADLDSVIATCTGPSGLSH